MTTNVFQIIKVKKLKKQKMEISISSMRAVAYTNHLTNIIIIHPKLFASKEEADAFGKEMLGNDYVASHVFFSKK